MAAVPWKLRGGAAASVGSITAIEFDPDVELLWVGDSFGGLISFTVQSHQETPVWSTYSSISASHRPVSNVFFLKMGAETMVTVPDREVIRGFKRGGVPMMCLPLPAGTQSYIDLFQANSHTGAMHFTGNNGLTRLTLREGEPDHVTVPLDESMVVALKQTRDFVATGSASGTLTVRNALDLSTVGQVCGSRSRVLAMDMFDYTIHAAYQDRNNTSVIKVYDVRKLSSNEPVSVIRDITSGNVSQLRRYNDSYGVNTDRTFVLTPQEFYIVQLDQDKPIYTSDTPSDGSCTSVAVSPSGRCAAIGNDKGHFFALAHPAARDEYIMSTYVQPKLPTPPTFTHSWVEPSVGSHFDETVDRSELASSWPPEDYMILSVPQRLRCVGNTSNAVIENEWGLIRADCYLPDPKDKLAAIIPNPFPFNNELGSDPMRVQKLLLELRKVLKRKNRSRGAAGMGEYEAMEDSLQVCYSMQHRFDWKSYNEIPHRVVGLDNSFPECWITPMLQCLYLCQPPEYPIRKVIMRHLCRREYCMTCEIAILFSNMMTTASSHLGLKGNALPPITQVDSLIRAMHQLRPFTASRIFEPAKTRDEAVEKMHIAQRLILETLHKDLQDQKGYPLKNYQPPSADYENSIAGLFGTEFSSNGRVHVEPRFFWDVPAAALKVDEGLQHLLKQLEAYKDQVQIKRLPPVIVLLLNSEHGSLKPPTSLKISRSAKEDYNYVLNSNIVHLADDVEDPGNFVSHQRVKDDNFVLVNDYRVSTAMKVQELERFIPATRSHCAVVTFYALDSLTAPAYAREGEENRPPNLWHTLGPLLTDDFFSKPFIRDPVVQGFKPAINSYTEIKPGDLVAIDAEYVVLRWSPRDDTAMLMHSTARRAHMALARVSCLLSQKDGDERPIVDDYVHTPEEVEDYVTQYSGIHPGDLDGLETTRHLTALKATYLKLRALVDGGVIFVGHGLAQDFRVCNISVPKRQIIDTLEIYHKAGARYLSLRFLAYHVLGESVQESEHDSIEDARTSLRLYRKYLQLKREGSFDKVLDHLLAKGAETSWFVPSSLSEVPMTPPVSLMGSPVFEKMTNDDGDGDGDDDASGGKNTESGDGEGSTGGGAPDTQLFDAIQQTMDDEDARERKAGYGKAA